MAMHINPPVQERILCAGMRPHPGTDEPELTDGTISAPGARGGSLRKIILLSGPRQSGKTTLSRMLHSDHQYINHDLAEHRLLLREKSWDRHKALIILDELHKMDD